MTKRAAVSPAKVFLLLCCVAISGALAGARSAAAAARSDPSYSFAAQAGAQLRLGLLAGATLDANTLISDVNFTAADSLDQAAVQSFLATQSGILDTYQAPDHSGAKRSAAAIIYQAAKAWQVSPKVILATLQKEQGLLSATQPSATALAWAMGCGLPDSGSPDTTYEGFGHQVWYGAESLHNNGQGWQAGITKVCGDGTVTPTDRASYALYCYTPWIGLADGGNKLFWTLYWQYFGDPLAVDALAPTTRVSGGGSAWHNKAVTLTLRATDNTGGTGVATTQYKLDGGAWTTAAKLTVAAPTTHANDGSHTVLYRSIDDAGNIEAARSCTVRIDTRRPRIVTNWAATVRTGHTASLRYVVSDLRPGSPTATVTIRVTTTAGHLVRKLIQRGVTVDSRHTARFVCRLAKGRYRFHVYATDAAGNTQLGVNSNMLTAR